MPREASQELEAEAVAANSKNDGLRKNPKRWWARSWGHFWHEVNLEQLQPQTKIILDGYDSRPSSGRVGPSVERSSGIRMSQGDFSLHVNLSVRPSATGWIPKFGHGRRLVMEGFTQFFRDTKKNGQRINKAIYGFAWKPKISLNPRGYHHFSSSIAIFWVPPKSRHPTLVGSKSIRGIPVNQLVQGDHTRPSNGEMCEDELGMKG